ncbi:MAG: ZIP family metal transporter [Bacteroidetes bacterium]|nr:ZIP family metal transporter [Bacteroidota bacterium]
MYFIIYLVLILTVLGSGSLVFLIDSGNPKIQRLLLAFSGAFLIGISFLKLIPEIYSTPAKHLGLFILLGYLIQLMLELITEGAEHGHSHVHAEGERVSPFLLLFGICIHSFLEGMPIAPGFNIKLQHTLVLGIVIHNLPISITMMSLFLHYGLSRRRAFTYLVIFALMTPLGSLFCRLLHVSIGGSIEVYFSYILAIVVGIFLHVSTSILFEAEENHQYNLRKFVTVCFGIIAAFGLSLL